MMDEVRSNSGFMRTNIDIDERLLALAMKVGGFKTKKAAVEGALRLLAGKKAYRDVLTLRGKIGWAGNPREMRRAKGR